MGSRNKKIRIYFDDREWHMLRMVASANNLSESKYAKIALLQKTEDLIRQAEAMREAARREQEGETETTSPMDLSGDEGSRGESTGEGDDGTVPAVQPKGAVESASAGGDIDSDEGDQSEAVYDSEEG